MVKLRNLATWEYLDVFSQQSLRSNRWPCSKVAENVVRTEYNGLEETSVSYCWAPLARLRASTVKRLVCPVRQTVFSSEGSVTGYMFRCPGCQRKQQLAAGTFMEGAHRPVKKLIALMYFWAYEEPVSKATAHTRVSSKTVIQWYQYFRDICSWKMLATVVSLGGPRSIVQIDESNKEKEKSERKSMKKK